MPTHQSEVDMAHIYISQSCERGGEQLEYLWFTNLIKQCMKIQVFISYIHKCFRNLTPIYVVKGLL